MLVDDAHRPNEHLLGPLLFGLRALRGERSLVRRVLVRVTEDQRRLALLAVAKVEPGDHLHAWPHVRRRVGLEVLGPKEAPP